MDFEAFFKVVADIAQADGMSYGIVGALSGVAFVLLHGMLPTKGLAYLFTPALFWGGLIGIYTARELGLALSSETAVNGAIAATAGMTMALVASVSVTRLIEAVVRARTPLASPAPIDRRLQI